MAIAFQGLWSAFSFPVSVASVPLLHDELCAAAELPSSRVPVTPGSLRVRNATYHPIRIALLPQINQANPVATAQSSTVANNQLETSVFSETPTPQYGDPIHWDFVPREGHDSGLVLAVTEGHIQLQAGDVITAFAQDGSRRYWGPYVVGVTDAPVWNSETEEWSLLLETPFPW